MVKSKGEKKSMDIEHDDIEEPKKKAKSSKRSKKAKAKNHEGNQPSMIFYLHSFLLFAGRILNRILNFYDKLFDMNQTDKAKIYMVSGVMPTFLPSKNIIAFAGLLFMLIEATFI